MEIAPANIGAMVAGGAEIAQPVSGLEQVFMDHKDLVFKTAYRVTGNATDAEDVLQSVFLKLLRQPHLPEIRSMRAYLQRAAINAALDLLRLRKDTQSLSLSEDENGGGFQPVSKDMRESDEVRDWLRHALARLNPKWAEMFVLRFIEDYSNGEIASLLKTSSAVVAVVLHRTRALLKKDFMASAREMATARGRR
ncbi:MAG TPA: sigma-70 family RNA polymerase sigma factor [Candidatus Solibacter sp.]|nr:sigma-70 family RNA polymerase sigma factor [Candidatus Solibacter sp.]